MSLSADFSETLALKALAWLVGNDELLPVFLGSTGASAEDLRTAARDRALMVSILDFLLLDDSWIMAFCDENAVPYEHPVQARAVLSGGSDMHWT